MKIDDKKLPVLYVLVTLFTIVLFIRSGSPTEEITDNRIERGKPGDLPITYNLDVMTGDREISDFELKVEPLDYTEEELELLFEECKNDVIDKVLDVNDSTEEVSRDLRFFTELKGYPFTFGFYPDESRIDKNGKIICPEMFETEIIVNVCYKSFSRDFGINVRVDPEQSIKEKLNTERFFEKIKLLIVERSTNDAMKEKDATGYVQLPDNVDGSPISFRKSEEKRKPAILLLCPLLVIAIKLGASRDKRKEKESRKKEILKEFPVLLQKMSMYLSAGMNIRNVWLTLCSDNGAGVTPLYEEMRISANELKSGVSESLVYEDFGARTGLPETVRLSALLSQNLKSGGTGLKGILKEDAAKAFTEQKQRAVKAGEEAGTKLLFPMMILLGDIIAIIMVPAFMSM